MANARDAERTEGRQIPPRPQAELHAHTTFSDGLLSPEELVALADDAGLAAVAVTDHDIVAGVEPARRAARGLQIEVISGVEYSSNLKGHEIHLLGIFLDDEDTRVVQLTEEARAFRRTRAEEIVDRLRGLGLSIDFERVEEAAGGGSIGRPHIAGVLVAGGVSDSLDDAFRRYIGIGRPAYVPKPTVTAEEVIDVVHAGGGVAILAHPGSSRVTADAIRGLAGIGLDGFEVRHPKHTPEQEAKLLALVKQLDLLASGGSDFHGPGKGRTSIGDRAVSVEWMEALRAAARENQQTIRSAKETT